MDKIRISAVSYLNALPFIYGIRETMESSSIDLHLDHPSNCAAKLINKEVDMGLIPVAALNDLSQYQIVSDYCIASHGPVKSVVMLSPSSVNKLKTIYLDAQSMTSVALTRLLVHRYWKINPEFVQLENLDIMSNLPENSAVVIIGDKSFPWLNAFPYRYDLAEEWFKYSGMPFVFAVWASNSKLPQDFINTFNHSLSCGIEMRKQISVDKKMNTLTSIFTTILPKTLIMF